MEYIKKIIVEQLFRRYFTRDNVFLFGDQLQKGNIDKTFGQNIQVMMVGDGWMGKGNSAWETVSTSLAQISKKTEMDRLFRKSSEFPIDPSTPGRSRISV